MKIDEQRNRENHYLVTSGVADDLEGVLAVTDYRDGVYRCAEELPDRNKGHLLEYIINYLDFHNYEHNLEEPLDKEPVPAEELEILAEGLEPSEDEERLPEDRDMSDSRRAELISAMLDHQKSPYS